MIQGSTYLLDALSWNLSFCNLKLGELGWKHVFQQVFQAHMSIYFPQLLKTSLLFEIIVS